MPNWSASEDALTDLQKIIKRRKKVSAFMSTEVKDGEIYDPLKETVILIAEAPISTLNRISKSLNAMYKSSDIKDMRRDFILKKKKEIDNEILKRSSAKW